MGYWDWTEGSWGKEISEGQDWGPGDEDIRPLDCPPLKDSVGDDFWVDLQDWFSPGKRFLPYLSKASWEGRIISL